MEAQRRGRGCRKGRITGLTKREHLVPEEISTFTSRPHGAHPTAPLDGILSKRSEVDDQ